MASPVVLCIDEYEPATSLLRQALLTFGYQALVAHTLEEASSILRAFDVDIIIYDYQLCCHDHYGPKCFAATAQRLQPHVKLVAWSTDDGVRGDNPPCAIKILLKPVAPKDLNKVLRELL